MVNLITALHRLATICPASRKASLRRELRFRRLITRPHTQNTPRKPSSEALRHGAAGRCGRFEASGRPFQLSYGLESHLEDLSNVVWGLTKLNIQNQVLFGQLAERIVSAPQSLSPKQPATRPRLSDFKPVNLSMSLWAFARAQIHDEPFLKAACEEALESLKSPS